MPREAHTGETASDEAVFNKVVSLMQSKSDDGSPAAASVGNDTVRMMMTAAPGSVSHVSTFQRAAVDDLERFARTELQAVAKKHGIKANRKSSVIITELRVSLARVTADLATLRQFDSPENQEGEHVLRCSPEKSACDFSEAYSD